MLPAGESEAESRKAPLLSGQNVIHHKSHNSSISIIMFDSSNHGLNNDDINSNSNSNSNSDSDSNSNSNRAARPLYRRLGNFANMI